MGIKIKNFKEFVNESKQVKVDKNLGVISETSLSKLWPKIQVDDFAVFTTFRQERPYEVNMNLLQESIKGLNQNELKPYLLDGYFPDVAIDVVNASENNLLVIRPKEMDIETFLDKISECLAEAERYSENNGLVPQEAALVCFSGGLLPSGIDEAGCYFMTLGKTFEYAGNHITFEKLNEYYSKMGKTTTTSVFAK